MIPDLQLGNWLGLPGIKGVFIKALQTVQIQANGRYGLFSGNFHGGVLTSSLGIGQPLLGTSLGDVEPEYIGLSGPGGGKQYGMIVQKGRLVVITFIVGYILWIGQYWGPIVQLQVKKVDFGIGLGKGPCGGQKKAQCQ